MPRGDAGSYVHTKRGPRQRDLEKDVWIDRNVQPKLWQEGEKFFINMGTDSKDATARMETMAAAVKADGGAQWWRAS